MNDAGHAGVRNRPSWFVADAALLPLLDERATTSHDNRVERSP